MRGWEACGHEARSPGSWTRQGEARPLGLRTELGHADAWFQPSDIDSVLVIPRTKEDTFLLFKPPDL